MLTITREVYYCDHCKRHWMTKAAALKHEARCIYNPNRTYCGWHDDKKPVGHAGTLAPQIKSDDLSTDELRVATDGCPACMLASVVQANLTTGQREDIDFDYAAEVARFREEEQRRDAF